MKTSLFFLLLLNLTMLSGAQGSGVIGFFPLEHAASHGFPDSFHIYMRSHLTRHSVTKVIIKEFDYPFDTEVRDSILRQQPMLAAAHGEIRETMQHEHQVVFRLLDFRRNILHEKIIPIQNNSLTEAALTAALQIRNTFEGNPLSRLRIDSEPSNLTIIVDGREEGNSPKELILNPGLHQIELKGYKIKNHSEIVHISSGGTENLYHVAKIDYYPTWLFMILAVATTWESALMYNVELENRNTNPNRAENARTTRLALSSIAAISWTGSGLCFWQNKKINKRYSK
ncbi:MAG: PEGA domain-containing protein [Fibrobacteres bacterium]|nr:PEGA domain-containing protein [Fibrobacterota bacterium]